MKHAAATELSRKTVAKVMASIGVKTTVVELATSFPLDLRRSVGSIVVEYAIPDEFNGEDFMRTVRTIGLTVLAALSAVALTAASASAATWSSSAKFASWSNGGYTVSNNVWGSGAGPQTIYANSYGNFWVTSNQPSPGNTVKSYPNSSKTINRTLSSLRQVTSSVNLSVPSSGTWDAAYDIWDNNYHYETMIWMNERQAGPLGSRVTTATVGGSTWNVYNGSNGVNKTFSFVRTSGTDSGSVDVLAVLRWIEARGWFGNITLGKVQFGFEVFKTSGTETFRVNSYSVSSS